MWLARREISTVDAVVFCVYSQNTTDATTFFRANKLVTISKGNVKKHTPYAPAPPITVGSRWRGVRA